MTSKTRAIAQASKDEVTPKGNLGRGLEDLHNSLTEAHRYFTLLESALEPVSFPVPDEERVGDGEACVEASPHARDLICEVLRLNGLTRRIAALTKQLDI